MGNVFLMLQSPWAKEQPPGPAVQPHYSRLLELLSSYLAGEHLLKGLQH